MLSDIKLLDRVIGEKKERDFKILQLLAEGWDEKDVALEFNLSKGRLSQIFTANIDLCDELTLRATLAKTGGRLRYAFKKLRRKADNGSSKDSLDWLQYVKTEVQGEKPLVDASTHYHFTNLKNEQLINEARRRGVALPPEIERRLEQVSKPE